MKKLLDVMQAGGAEASKEVAYPEVDHPEWNVIVSYIVNTLDYDPNSKHYDKGLEVIQMDLIPLCAHLSTEDWFHEEANEAAEDMAEECGLDKVEPGFYRCVCGLGVNGSEWTSHEGVTEYDTEAIPYMISRTKLSRGDAEYYIKLNEYHPPEDEEIDVI